MKEATTLGGPLPPASGSLAEPRGCISETPSLIPAKQRASLSFSALISFRNYHVHRHRHTDTGIKWGLGNSPHLSEPAFSPVKWG